MILPEAQPAQRRQCSAKGCRHEATYALVWRNPRIHDGDRRKTWLACEEHVEHLSSFLRTRGFPLEVDPLD